MSTPNRARRRLRPHGHRSPRLNLERLEERLALSILGGVQPMGSGQASPTGKTPAQIRTAYGIDNIVFGSVAGDGTGQTIAIVDVYDNPKFVNSTAPNFSTSDLAQFDRQFGLPDPPSFTKLNQTGGTALPGTDPSGAGTLNWELEEALDVEWAHAIAPKASIILIECNSPFGSDLYTGVATAARLPGVSVISMSWGGGEYPGERTDDGTYFVTPSGHQGVTFLASTGDSGSPGGYPADSPNVVAVGGTTLNLNPDGTYASETAWSGSGGGTSTYEPEPSYQQGVQSTGKRTIPDVASDADPNTGVAVYDSYNFGATPWIQIGGTSLSAPTWAGLIAIANQGRVAEGGATLDGPRQTLPALYALPSAVYHDITSGSNGGFSAGVGYDQVTGLGSPKADLLIPGLTAYKLANHLVVTAQPPSNVAAGSPFGMQVAAEDANGNIDSGFSGNVTLTLPGGGTATQAAVRGVASFNGLVVNQPGTGDTIRADAGGLASATSAPFNVNGLSAPTGLTVTATTPGALRLSWSGVSGAADYLVQRSPDGTNWTQITDVAAGTATLTADDTGLAPATAYSYRVQATAGSSASPYSAVASGTTSATAPPATLVSDGFDGSSLSTSWKADGGTWAQSGGVVRQTGTAAGDPKKLVAVGRSFPADVVVAAKVRVDNWAGGDSARAGVGLGTDPAGGNGYNLLFHNDTNTVQFLNDHVAWGNSYSFAWTPGAWYWFELEQQGGKLLGKVWADGSAEPSGWMFEQDGWADRAGAPALNGGSNAAAAASFDEFSVVDPNASAPTGLSAPTGVSATATTPGALRLSWSAVSGAADYLVERSPDGANWTQITDVVAAAGVATLTADDVGLAPSTTYSYRVRAAAGSSTSPYSSVAPGTTVAAAPPSPLAADGFDAASLSSSWSAAGGAWSQSGGVVRQAGTAAGDPKKLVAVGRSYPADVVVTAKVRVDAWAGGDAARAGVGLATDAATGRGYNLLFHNDTHTVQFLDDQVRWGNAYSFAWSPGAWYWFELKQQGGVLYGKVWADGSAEPSGWMFEQDGWADRGGAPALNGGTNAGATASFDEFSVVDPNAVALSAPTGLSATVTTPGALRLSWSAVPGATDYLVERSPDGANWTQVTDVGNPASAATLTADDVGLAPSTTYSYRIRAVAGSSTSPYSTTAQGTTASTSPPSPLTADGFDGSSLSSSWAAAGGAWSQSGGVVRQAGTTAGDPKKLVAVGRSFPTNVVVTAKVRVDTWAGGDYARAGVGLYTNASTGAGYNLVFHNNTNTVQFLDDGVAWGNSYSFAWSPGAWYWFKLQEQGGKLLGKVWADGSAEPAGWMFEQDGWSGRTGGAVALNGGSHAGATASFDEFGAADPGAVASSAPTGLLAAAPAAGTARPDQSEAILTGDDRFIDETYDGTSKSDLVAATPTAGAGAWGASRAAALGVAATDEALVILAREGATGALVAGPLAGRHGGRW